MSSILNRFDEKEEDVNLDTEKYLTFLIDKQYYAYPIKDVREIIEMQPITEIPEFPSYAKGIIDLRNKVVPIIDVRLRFYKPEIEYTERTCIIVLDIKDIQIGFIVDTVDEVIDISEENISSAPAITSDRSTRYIEGIGRVNSKIIMILDALKMLNDEDLQAFDFMNQ
ncbi:MAG TPA: purine-binding chemotaxis protein CheW [Clostridiales bacterium]|nr:purine-binding chemotaxis protein CheW [Clostridiales bacterium]